MSRNTIAQIDLSAVRHNLARVRARASSAQVAAVVKADAYGHGLERICVALDGADLLAVATTSEGLQCRNAGWRGRLLLLEGPSNQAELSDAHAMQAEIVVHHPSQIGLLRNAGTTWQQRLWLKIDSGMHRLGFPASQASEVFAALEGLRGDQGTMLMSHFACADEPDNPLTRQQIQRFDQAVADIPGPQSLANSAALVNFPGSHRDVVRPGIMLYGISPCTRKTSADLGLQCAMTLSCELIAVNDVPAGETIGYGATFRCPSDMRVGVAAIGYGDGYPRHARTGTPVLVDGHRSRLLGRVSMDMITVDLSHLPRAKVGDRVVLWGEGLPIEEVAPWADAIPYQLICGVTARVRYELLG